MVEFMQSYRLTGQLFFKLLHGALQAKSARNAAYLPILKVLKKQGSMTQSAIAREIFHSDAAVSRQINLLAEEGLVSTRLDPENRRATIVELQESGERLLEELETIITDALADTLSEMPNEQIQQLINSNDQLQTIITSKLEKEPRA